LTSPQAKRQRGGWNTGQPDTQVPACPPPRRADIGPPDHGMDVSVDQMSVVGTA